MGQISSLVGSPTRRLADNTNTATPFIHSLVKYARKQELETAAKAGSPDPIGRYQPGREPCRLGVATSASGCPLG